MSEWPKAGFNKTRFFISLFLFLCTTLSPKKSGLNQNGSRPKEVWPNPGIRPVRAWDRSKNTRRRRRDVIFSIGLLRRETRFKKCRNDATSSFEQNLTRANSSCGENWLTHRPFRETARRQRTCRLSSIPLSPLEQLQYWTSYLPNSCITILKIVLTFCISNWKRIKDVTSIKFWSVCCEHSDRPGSLWKLILESDEELLTIVI